VLNEGDKAGAASVDRESSAESVRGSTAAVRRSQRFRRALERLGLLPAPPEGLAFHAFISYSHGADGPLARALQRGLQRFAKPWNRARALHVFRDEASLAANPNLWREIERALDASEYYILLASPPAAASHWVRKEAERWMQTKPNDHLFLALTDGSIVWDHSKDDFDWDQTTALPPTLRGAFEDQPPLWVDLRWAREAPDLSLSDPRFTDAVVSLAAPIHGRQKDELAGEEVREHRRTVRIARRAVIALVTLTALAVVGGAIALIQRAHAIHNERSAQSELLVTQSRSTDDLQLASLQALVAQRLSPSLDTRSEILTLAANRQIGLPHAGYSGDATIAAFSPDQRTVAFAGGPSGSHDHTVRLWDVATGKQLGPPLAGHTGAVSAVTFSPNGRTLASGGQDGIRLWDVVRHRQLASLKYPSFTGIGNVAFSPDGRTLAWAAFFDRTIQLWDLSRHRHLGELRGQSGVSHVQFSPDGRTLAAGSTEHTIQLWDVTRRRRLGAPLTGHTGDIVALAFSPDGQTLASAAGGDKAVRLWDVATRSQNAILYGHTDQILALAFSRDGQTLASGSSDTTIRLWDAAGTPLGDPLTGHSGAVDSVAFRSDGRTLASVSTQDHTIRVWDRFSPRQLGDRHTGQSVAFSPDGRTLASADPSDNHIRLWNVATSKQLGTPLGVHSAPVTVALSPDGRTLAVGSDDNTLQLWDVTRHLPLGAPLIGPHDVSGVRYSLAFSPDGRRLASVADPDPDSYVFRLWDVASHSPVPDSAPRYKVVGGVIQNEASSVAFSPNGRTLALEISSGNADHSTVRLWDIRRHSQVGGPIEPGPVSSFAFSPDGRTLALGSGNDNTVRLWNVIRRHKLGAALTGPTAPVGKPSTGHTATVSAVAFSPDKQTLASGSSDGTIRLWDLRSRRILGAPLISPEEVDTVAFSPDGHTLASTDSLVGDTFWLWTNYSVDIYARRLCDHINTQQAPQVWRQAQPSIPYQPVC
jgi:WD40 repeat protein